MLSIAAITTDTGYYTKLAATEYFHAGGEPPGVWYGEGAEALGLTGVAHETQVTNLAQGLSPDGSEALVRISRKSHQPGWDLTFSAPKSVSVAWASADESLRLKIQQCHFRAVCHALDFLQENLLQSRVGKGGRGRVVSKLVSVIFEHGSSRSEDPLLHSHALIMNIGVCDDRCRTIVSLPFYIAKMLLGALYRSALSAELQREIGFRMAPDASSFRLKGVPRKLVEVFSKRRHEIEDRLESLGKSSALASQFAALETRKSKEVQPRKELLKEWQSESRRYGFSSDRVRQISGKIARTVDPYPLVDSAFRKLDGTRSTFTTQDLLRETALLGQVYGVPIRRLEKAVRKFIVCHPEVVPLENNRLTSKSNLRLEAELLDSVMAPQARGCRRFIPKTSLYEKHMVKNGHLSWEQSSAVGHMVLNPGTFQAVVGMAGTGKTTTIKAAADIWKADGYQVIGACISGKAARELATHAGIKTFTIAKLKMGFQTSLANVLWHHAKQLGRAAMKKPTFSRRDLPRLTSKTILILDEAGMLGTRDLAEIHAEASKVGCKVVAIGDSKQIQPMEKGTPFYSLVKRLGGVVLSEILRQKDAFDRQVVKDMHDGRVADALQNLSDRGLLHVFESRAQAREQMVQDWGKSKHRNDPMFVPTREEAEDLNRKCQDFRLRNGELKKKSGHRLGTRKFFVGDRVSFRENSDRFEVRNGDLGTITALNARKDLMSVRLDTGKTVLIEIKRYQAFGLGYAMTAHKGQGTTVENAFVLLGGSMQDQHLGYVQLSRARGTTNVYIDRMEAGEELEFLTKSLGRDRKDLLAHEYRKTARPSSPEHGISFG